MSIASTLLALLIEATAGYPGACAGRHLGHPVMWFGEPDRPAGPGAQPAGARRRVRKAAGTAALFVIVCGSGRRGRFTHPQWTLLLLPYGFVPGRRARELADRQRSLHQHVARVADALDLEGLEKAAARAVSRDRRRDPPVARRSGRGARRDRSLAENFSDGIVAPVFWLAVGGLPAVLAI